MAKTAVVSYCIVLVSIIGFEAVTAQLDCSNLDADVLIFGAGTAGLTAARLLHDSEINILVLEANNYRGGRVKQEDFGGFDVEVGANWIHEAGNNDMNKLSNPIYKLSQDQTCFSSGGLLSGHYTYAYGSSRQNDANKLEVVSVSSEELKNTLKEYNDGFDGATELPNLTGKSVREGLTEVGWTWNPNSDHLKQLVEWSEFDFNYAATPEDSSLSLTAANEGFGDSCYLVTDSRGYATILECIAKPFRNKIMTRAKVTSIT